MFLFHDLSLTCNRAKSIVYAKTGSLMGWEKTVKASTKLMHLTPAVLICRRSLAYAIETSSWLFVHRACKTAAIDRRMVEWPNYFVQSLLPNPAVAINNFHPSDMN